VREYAVLLGFLEYPLEGSRIVSTSICPKLSQKHSWERPAKPIRRRLSARNEQQGLDRCADARAPGKPGIGSSWLHELW
jgi:hypothetical protein